MPFFDIFASPRWSPLRMRTKVVSFFIFFQELSNKKKIKALRPKMTKIASRGGSCLKLGLTEESLSNFSSKFNHSAQDCRCGWAELLPSWAFTWLNESHGLSFGRAHTSQLIRALKVACNGNSWRKVDHVLLSSAEWNSKQTLQSIKTGPHNITYPAEQQTTKTHWSNL